MKGKPSVSFCLLSDADPTSTLPLLELVRPHVKEIVVACDEKMGHEALAGYEAVSEIDKLFTARIERPIERFLEALMRECESDWIIRLDSDEIPSVGLLELLDDLSVVHRCYTHAWLKCYWLWPDGGHVLDGPPWGLDRQLRLFRNVPPLWELSTTIHSPPRVLGPGVMLNEEFFHATLLQMSSEERREKAAVYERLGHGIRTRQGASTNVAYYMPEIAETPLSVRKISDLDRQNIGNAMKPRSRFMRASKSKPQSSKPQSLTSTKIPVQISDASNYSSLLKLKVAEAINTQAGYPFVVETSLINESDMSISLHGDPPLQIGARWITYFGDDAPGEERAPIPAVIPSRFSIHTPLEMRECCAPGEYLLQVDLVTEGVCWHEVGTTVKVTVEKSIRSDFHKYFVDYRNTVRPLDRDAAFLVYSTFRTLSTNAQILVASDSDDFHVAIKSCCATQQESIGDPERWFVKIEPDNYLDSTQKPTSFGDPTLLIWDWDSLGAGVGNWIEREDLNLVIYVFSHNVDQVAARLKKRPIGKVTQLLVYGDPVSFSLAVSDAGLNWKRA